MRLPNIWLFIFPVATSFTWLSISYRPIYTPDAIIRVDNMCVRFNWFNNNALHIFLGFFN